MSDVKVSGDDGVRIPVDNCLYELRVWVASWTVDGGDLNGGAWSCEEYGMVEVE